jgi:DegV family protein with EDD domain
MIAVVTDSAGDLPEDIARESGVEIVPAYINIGQESLRDCIDLSRREFYERLPRLSHPPTTSAPAPGAFKETYEALLERASHIVSIHTASTLSSIFNTARLAAELVDPARVHVIDTGQVSMGVGWVVKVASEAARQSATLEGVLHSVRDTLKRVRVYAVLDTLEYLARSGRVNMVQLGLSNLLNIKPLVELHEGTVRTLSRIRTWSRTINALAEQVETLKPVERLAVMHSNCADFAQEFMERVKEIMHPEETLIVDVTTVIGSHVGPGAIGIAAVLDE